MIAHEKIWPSNKVITTHNVIKDFEFYFENYTTCFNCDKESSINQIALIEVELMRLENKRDNISGNRYYDSDIELYPFFKRGWDMAIYGNFEVWKPSYFHFDNSINKTNIVIKAIKAKYAEKELPEDYFEQLSNEGEMQIIQGMASSKYYYWLKEQQNEILQNAKEIKSTYPDHLTFYKKYFSGESEFSSAIDVLIKEKFIDKTTFVFVDENKGNKTAFAETLKSFQGKGYYKSKISNEDYVEIALRVFRIEISIDTFKHSKSIKV